MASEGSGLWREKKERGIMSTEPTYEERVQAMEQEGMTTSDAQGVVDAQIRRQKDPYAYSQQDIKNLATIEDSLVTGEGNRPDLTDD